MGLKESEKKRERERERGKGKGEKCTLVNSRLNPIIRFANVYQLSDFPGHVIGNPKFIKEPCSR
jgi:hypothetical protein